MTSPRDTGLRPLTRLQFQRRAALRDAILRRRMLGAPGSHPASEGFTDPVRDLRLTARHEAAHAATYALLALRFRKVSIVGRPRWGYNGRVSIASLGETEAEKDERVKAEKVARTEQWRVTRHNWLTGVVAAWTAEGHSLSNIEHDEEYQADYYLACELARLINEFDHSGDRVIIGESETHARLLLADHARAYDAVAEALFDRLTLSESEVLAVCRANTNPCPVSIGARLSLLAALRAIGRVIRRCKWHETTSEPVIIGLSRNA